MVDDNGLGLVARKSVLEELGHRITIASTAEDALELFTRQRFDMVITDFKMPKMNGIELTVQIRKVCADIPVILISGFTDALGLNEATTGADLVIQKSSREVTQLIRGVNRLMRRMPRKPAGSESPSRLRKSQASSRASGA